MDGGNGWVDDLLACFCFHYPQGKAQPVNCLGVIEPVEWKVSKEMREGRTLMLLFISSPFPPPPYLLTTGQLYRRRDRRFCSHLLTIDGSISQRRSSSSWLDDATSTTSPTATTSRRMVSAAAAARNSALLWGRRRRRTGKAKEGRRPAVYMWLLCVIFLNFVVFLLDTFLGSHTCSSTNLPFRGK